MTFFRLNIVFIALSLTACASEVVVPQAAKSRIGLNGMVVSPPSTVTVLRADNLHSIARMYGVDEQEIVRINSLAPPYQLAQGQTLQLPPPLNLGHTFDKTLSEAPTLAAVPNDAVMASDLAPPTRGVITQTDLAPPTGATASTDNAPLVPSPFAKPPVIASIPATPPVKSAIVKTSLGTGMPSFTWPVTGSTLSVYGAKAGGRFNDGVNIGAPLGTPVRAAAQGEVAYSGDKVAGFGNLILIKHSGGFATAYAHVQNPNVKQGQHIAAGQAIAQIGKTGNVSTPQLHFEIRKGTAAVNPASYLP